MAHAPRARQPRVPRHRRAARRHLRRIPTPTGRVGAEAGTRRLRLVGNVGRFVRVPTLGVVYGGSGVVHGNPQLAPEEEDTRPISGLRAQTRGVGASSEAPTSTPSCSVTGSMASLRTSTSPRDSSRPTTSDARACPRRRGSRGARADAVPSRRDRDDVARSTRHDAHAPDDRQRPPAVPVAPRRLAAVCAATGRSRSATARAPPGYVEVRAVYQSSRYVDLGGPRRHPAANEQAWMPRSTPAAFARPADRRAFALRDLAGDAKTYGHHWFSALLDGRMLLRVGGIVVNRSIVRLGPRLA